MSSPRYHFNPDTGEVRACKAKAFCPFGGKPADHYSSQEEARAAAEAHLEKEFPLFGAPGKPQDSLVWGGLEAPDEERVLKCPECGAWLPLGKEGALTLMVVCEACKRPVEGGSSSIVGKKPSSLQTVGDLKKTRWYHATRRGNRWLEGAKNEGVEVHVGSLETARLRAAQVYALEEKTEDWILFEVEFTEEAALPRGLEEDDGSYEGPQVFQERHGELTPRGEVTSKELTSRAYVNTVENPGDISIITKPGVLRVVSYRAMSPFEWHETQGLEPPAF